MLEPYKVERDDSAPLHADVPKKGGGVVVLAVRGKKREFWLIVRNVMPDACPDLRVTRADSGSARRHNMPNAIAQPRVTSETALSIFCAVFGWCVGQ